MSIDPRLHRLPDRLFSVADRKCRQRAGQHPAADRFGQERHDLCGLRQPDPGADRHARRQCAQQRLHHRDQPGVHPGVAAGHAAHQPVQPGATAADRDRQCGANNDASDLMTQAQSIFSQASGILNSKDANGNYIFSGGNTGTAPVAPASLSDLAALPATTPAASNAFTNGTFKTSGAGRRWPDRDLWRHRVRRRHRPDAGTAVAGAVRRRFHRQSGCRQQPVGRPEHLFSPMPSPPPTR